MFFSTRHRIERKVFAMTHQKMRPSDEPLTSMDLAICQRGLEAVSADLRVARNSEKGQQLASIIVQLYRRGVCDEDNLKTMASAAGGALSHDE
jgi:hypothetical protein